MVEIHPESKPSRVDVGLIPIRVDVGLISIQVSLLSGRVVSPKMTTFPTSQTTRADVRQISNRHRKCRLYTDPTSTRVVLLLRVVIYNPYD